MKFEQYLSIKDFGIDYTSKCLNECLQKEVKEINEGFGIDLDMKVESEEEFPDKGYIIQSMSMKGVNDRINYNKYVTYPEKYYIGDEKNAKFLLDKRGLTKLQPAYPEKYNVCNIGFNEKENKWVGWSHRAICSFGIGDKIFEENFGDGNTPFVKHGKDTIKNLDDAKIAAKNFAEYVS